MALFQYYGGYGGGVWSNFMYWLDYWGVRDIILPFILIFTIIFAVLQKIQIFGANTSKRYNIVISLVISILTIIPHATGAYPPDFDVVNIINNALPEVALLIIVVVLLLIMLGIGFGGDVIGKNISGGIALISAAILILIFTGAITPLPVVSYIDPGVQALIVIFLIFGLIVWFITKEPSTGGENWLQKLFKDIGSGKNGGSP